MHIVIRAVAGLLAAAITALGAGAASAATPEAAAASITKSNSSTSYSTSSTRMNSSPSAHGTELGQRAADAALTKIGSAFRYGGTGPASFDNAGLTRWAWAQAGITIARTTSAQASSLPRVALNQLQPGDLVVAYTAPGQPVALVAIYVGNGIVVSAEHKGVVCVPISALGPDPSGRRVAL